MNFKGFSFFTFPMSRPAKVTPDGKVRQLHMAIDVQDAFARTHLSQEREVSLPYSIRSFGDEALPSIPTLWITFNKRYPHLPAPDQADERVEATRSFFELPPLRQGEYVFEKPKAGAFAETNLTDFLRDAFPNLETIGVSGLLTTDCIKATLSNGLTQPYRFAALYNLMGDFLEYKNPAVTDPAWHRDTLRNLIGPDHSKIDFVTAAEFLAIHKKEPAPPLRAVPVQNLPIPRPA